MTFKEELNKAQKAYDIVFQQLKKAAALGYYYLTIPIEDNFVFTSLSTVFLKQGFDVRAEENDIMKILWNKGSSTRSEQYKQIKGIMKQYHIGYKLALEQIEQKAYSGEYYCEVKLDDSTETEIVQNIAAHLKYVDNFYVVCFPVQREIQIKWQVDANSSDDTESSAMSFLAAKANALRKRVLLKIENAARQGEFETDISFNEPKQLREALLAALQNDYNFGIERLQKNLVVINWRHENSDSFIYNSTRKLALQTITQRDNEQLERLVKDVKEYVLVANCSGERETEVFINKSTSRWVVDQVVKAFYEEGFRVALQEDKKAFKLCLSWKE